MIHDGQTERVRAGKIARIERDVHDWIQHDGVRGARVGPDRSRRKSAYPGEPCPAEKGSGCAPSNSSSPIQGTGNLSPQTADKFSCRESPAEFVPRLVCPTRASTPISGPQSLESMSRRSAWKPPSFSPAISFASACASLPRAFLPGDVSERRTAILGGGKESKEKQRERAGKSGGAGAASWPPFDHANDKPPNNHSPEQRFLACRKGPPCGTRSVAQTSVCGFPSILPARARQPRSNGTPQTEVCATKSTARAVDRERMNGICCGARRRPKIRTSRDRK